MGKHSVYTSSPSTHTSSQRDRGKRKDFNLSLNHLLLAIVIEKMLDCVKQEFNIIWILPLCPFPYLICKVAASVRHRR